jgi:hypothetical protein
LPAMNSALQASWRIVSRTNCRWVRRWFFKKLLCNENFDYRHASNINISSFTKVNNSWFGFPISSTGIQILTRF